MPIPSFEEVMKITDSVSSNAALENPEAKALYECCREVRRWACVVEVGCQLGRSSSIITQMASALNFYSLHIDPYTGQPEFMQQWATMMYRVGGVQEHAFTLLCMRTEQAEWHLEKLAPFDLAYIDGDHGTAEVEMDLALVACKIRRGGLLACHDYGRESLPTVKSALDGFIDERWKMEKHVGTLGVWRRQ